MSGYSYFIPGALIQDLVTGEVGFVVGAVFSPFWCNSALMPDGMRAVPFTMSDEDDSYAQLVEGDE